MRAATFLALLLALAGCRAMPGPGAGAVRPNILLIVSDDQGYHDLGCFGSKEVKLPNLDRIAAGGVRLTNFYVTWPACTPSRASLLTGRYPQRNGIYDMIRNEAPDYGHKYTPEEYAVTFENIGGMDVREILLPAVLKRAGYASGIFGKWDLGVSRRFLPLQKGFDAFYGFSNTGIDYYTHERYGVPSMFRDNAPTIEDKGTYCTDLFAREAERFIRDHRDRPFLLYLPFNAPHSASNLDPNIRGAAQAPDRYKARYPHLKEGARKATRYGKPAEVPTREARRLRYLASLSAMDDRIGDLLDLLEKFHVDDRTIVIFFSDNGGGSGSDNAPLRGHKGQMYEGGIRVPCLVKWPGKIPPGTTSDAFLTSLEILPTLCAATRAAPPEGVELDGFDMMEVLAGRAPSKRTEMFWQRRGHKAARVGSLKWVSIDGQEALYDLAADIGEQKDLSKARPDALRRMRTRFAAWARAMEAAEPRGPFRNY